MIRILACLATSIALCGCAASSLQLVPLPDQDNELTNRKQCRVYVARDGEWRGFPRDVLVYDGEKAIGILEQETYLCWERAPGPGVLRVLYKDQKLADGDVEGRLELELEAGQVYYIGVLTDSDLGRPAPHALGKEVGLELLSRRRSPADR